MGNAESQSCRRARFIDCLLSGSHSLRECALPGRAHSRSECEPLKRQSMNLALLQLCDSALPIGGYSHSWGLEAAIARGRVRDPSGLESWTRSWLRHVVGPCE